MIKRLKVLALVFSAWTSAAFATPVTLGLAGIFQSAPTDNLANPANGNQLSSFVGRSFSSSFTWESNPVGISSPPNNGVPYYTQLNNAGDRAWAFFPPSRPTFNSGAFGYTGQNVVIETQNDWYYDGSEGMLAAGTYDVVNINGWMIDVPCGDIYTCPPGVQLPAVNFNFSISLIGSADLLGGRDVLPGADLAVDKLVFGAASLAKYNNLNQIVGEASTWGTVSGSFNDLTIQAVPEPNVLALLALGALGCVVSRKRKKSAI
jgi:hypothetical protein